MIHNLWKKFFKKEKNDDSHTDSLDTTQVNIDKNWYSERYETLTTQRNLLLLLIIISFIAVISSVLVVGKISTSKSFSPFVIRIEETTGSAKVVNPTDSEVLSGNEALARYFLKKYLIARETYNPVDFDYNMRKVVRVFSASGVYRNYIGFIRNPRNDPTTIYGQRNTTFLNIKSISEMEGRYFIRFSINETAGSERTFNKIATIRFDYVPMELEEDERDINPVGFQVTGYRVDDDAS